MDIEPLIDTENTEGLKKDYSGYPESQLTQRVIGAAIEVHRRLGPGFLERVYENTLVHELRSRAINVAAQFDLEVRYKDVVVGVYCCDLLVEGRVLCEIKATSGIDPAHEAQLINYLKGTGIRVGLLLNFGAPKLQTKRMIF